MNPSASQRFLSALPVLAGVVGLLALGFWFGSGYVAPLRERVPGTDQRPDAASSGASNPVLSGKLQPGPGKPSSLPGDWPGFRGPNRDNISPESVRLSETWSAQSPKKLWSVEVGEGYAGPAVRHGRVYLMDYDRDRKQDALRCLSLEDGAEIWRFAYPVAVKRNHGMSRTVPTVTDRFVVAIGPKCHVVCLDALTGELRWGLDLVKQYGTTVPQWYAGQCPLVESNTVILAPGGKDALLLALNLETGQPLWQTPNPHDWKMTHASVMAWDAGGQRQYVYCASHGVVGVSARDGSLLWETPDWKISIATVPSPVPLPDGRLFLTGGYNAGSLLLQLRESDGRFQIAKGYRLTADVFGATQQTPIFDGQNLYGVRSDGRFVCLDLDGKVRWTSDPGLNFGLGAFLEVDRKILVVNDKGELFLIEAKPERFRLLARTQVLSGRECWGPMAWVGGKLLVRDLTKLACFEGF